MCSVATDFEQSIEAELVRTRIATPAARSVSVAAE